MTDTHAHLYLKDFSADIDAVMDRCRQHGVGEIFLPAIDRSEHEPLLELEARFPDLCRAMMGLHPCSVKEDMDEELRIVEDHLKQRSFRAIGETGLDYYWDLTYKQQQIEAFEQQIRWAKEYAVPIVIHSRNSIDDCIALIEKHHDAQLRGVFHCFSGTPEQAERIMKLGFYMGIGGVITYKKSGLSQVVEKIPMNYLVLETDAPYLTPVPFRGKRNESSYLTYIAEAVAQAKGLTLQEVDEATTRNAQKLFVG